MQMNIKQKQIFTLKFYTILICKRDVFFEYQLTLNLFTCLSRDKHSMHGIINGFV